MLNSYADNATFAVRYVFYVCACPAALRFHMDFINCTNTPFKLNNIDRSIQNKI